MEIPLDSYCCGQYASYWNAFLLRVKLLGRIFLNIFRLVAGADPGFPVGGASTLRVQILSFSWSFRKKAK